MYKVFTVVLATILVLANTTVAGEKIITTNEFSHSHCNTLHYTSTKISGERVACHRTAYNQLYTDINIDDALGLIDRLCSVIGIAVLEVV